MEAHDGSEELDDAGIDKAYSKDANDDIDDDLAEEKDDDMNDGTMSRI
jgi:hypothetical protein